MFEAIHTEIVDNINDFDMGLLITFASKQNKLIPPRINIVRHDMQEVLILVALCLRQ